MQLYQIREKVRVKSLKPSLTVPADTEGTIRRVHVRADVTDPFSREITGFLVYWDDFDAAETFQVNQVDTLEAIAGPLPGGYWHKEAFCLMTYQCDETGECERIWNSRDGVTPFVIPTRDGKASMTHILWDRDRCEPEFCCDRGMRIFVDMPQEVALAYARMHWNMYLERCEAEQIKPHDPENGLQRFFEDYYKDGKAPHLVTL